MTRIPLLGLALSVCITLTLLALTVSAQKRLDDLRPTVILISIDGMRADYLDRYQPPTLSRLAASGVRAKWMVPSFPTKTFPNHYTVATGLYPANHGIVENNVYDFGTVLTMSKRFMIVPHLTLRVPTPAQPCP